MSTRRWIAAAVLASGWAIAAFAAAPDPISSVRAVAAMGDGEARRELPAMVEGVVADFQPSKKPLFLDETGMGLYRDAITDLAPARRVRFGLLLSRGDTTMGAPPAWLDSPRLVELVLLAIFCAGVWMLMGERKVRRQIASLAYAESRRSKILEDINNSRPLAEILERVTELVSARLNGAACWCEVANGARLGNPPPRLDTNALRVVEKAIPARSGPALGTLYVAFDANAGPQRDEADALAMAAGLATLAIETERLYSDLVHRSEFDQLTDIQNRFSFERRLAEAIQTARQSAGIFGLLYIDLNDFKQVNDLYGHRAGDLYLKEAAKRMTRQLRPGDCLARLGGDEFAVLLPDVHSREAVEEIALRLEACFEEPYQGEGHLVRGSASIGIAMYPEDAMTNDGLLSAADSAMYLDKERRFGKNQGTVRQRDRQM